MRLIRPRHILTGVIRTAATILLLLTLTPFVHSERLPIKIYTTADGLARDCINRIRQDSHGFIWFCTTEGISRFDGYGFTNYGVADGLPHRIVNDFLETRNGAYLFATQGGLVQYEPISPDTNGPRFTHVELESNELSNWVISVIEDSSGTVWCGTLKGVYRLDREANAWQSRFIDFHSHLPPSVNALAFDSEGSLLVGTSYLGLYRLLRDRTVEHYTEKNGLSQNGISSLLLDREGRVWVGTGTGLTLLRKNLRPNENIAQHVYKTRDGLLNDFIQCLYQSSNGRFWVGTRGGLCLLVEPKENNDLSFRGYTTANGLQNIWIQSITEDRGNNLWIGAQSGGAMKMPLGGFTSYFETDELGNGLINQLFSDPKGNTYAVTQSVDGLAPVIVRFDGNHFVREKPNLPPKTQLTWGWNQLILRDHTGDWWIPTAQGIYRFSRLDSFSELASGRPRVYSMKDGMSDNQVFRLFEDARGDLWFSTLGNPGRQLNRWERSSDKVYVYVAEENGIPAVPPTAFVNDSGGNLWIGFYSGYICRYANGQFTLFTEKDGVPKDFVRDMLLDSKKRLWIATNSGLLRVDDPLALQPQFINYTAKQGRASDQATTVVEDRWGQIYVGTGRGLDRLDPDTGKIKHYTTADGLADNFVNVSMRDSQGALWFGTYRGLSRFVPEQENALAPPPIIISGLTVAGVKQTLSGLGEKYVQVPELNYRQNQLQIDFLSISYAPGDVLRYQFKVENSGSDWSVPSDQRTITLANLAPGTYRFLARAINSDGVTSSQPATYLSEFFPQSGFDGGSSRLC